MFSIHTPSPECKSWKEFWFWTENEKRIKTTKLYSKGFFSEKKWRMK